MATQLFCLVFLSMVIHASFSLTIPLDVKTVKSSDSVRKSELVENDRAALDPRLRSREVAELEQMITLVDAVPSLELEKGEHGRIVKRAIIGTPVKCAGDMFEFAGRCWTKEQYDRKMKDQQ